jgi:hypothetical protein
MVVAHGCVAVIYMYIHFGPTPMHCIASILYGGSALLYLSGHEACALSKQEWFNEIACFCLAGDFIHASLIAHSPL